MAKIYEVNLATRDGWHILATDSRIRRYPPPLVAEIICTLKDAFPDHKVSVTCFDGSLDDIVQAALDGTIDRKRLDKAVGRFRLGVMNQRSNDYVGEADAED